MPYPTLKPIAALSLSVVTSGFVGTGDNVSPVVPSMEIYCPLYSQGRIGRLCNGKTTLINPGAPMEVVEFVIQHPEKYATWNASIDSTTGQTLALYATDYTVYSESTLLDLPSGAVQLSPIFYPDGYGEKDILYLLPEKHWGDFYLLLEEEEHYQCNLEPTLMDALYEPLGAPFWTNQLVRTCYVDRMEKDFRTRAMNDLSWCSDLIPSAFSHDLFSFSKRNGQDAGAILFTGTYSQCMHYQMRQDRKQ